MRLKGKIARNKARQLKVKVAGQCNTAKQDAKKDVVTGFAATSFLLRKCLLNVI